MHCAVFSVCVVLPRYDNVLFHVSLCTVLCFSVCGVYYILQFKLSCFVHNVLLLPVPFLHCLTLSFTVSCQHLFALTSS